MKIQLIKLQINHFKGIKSLEVDFGSTTNIRGDNATGKTTIMDAFLWLLFGKDSTDRKEFEIKHISVNGNGSPKFAEVEGILLVDERKVMLKRVFQEKWTKKRGSIEAEFTGHETSLFFNEVPVSLREYQEKISAICSEDVFKMVTSPWYFSSLHWEVQRKILFEMAGNGLSDQEIARGNKAFEALLNELTGKTLQEYKRQISAQKRRLKGELELIPARIDEVNRSMPAELNWNDLSGQLDQAQQELNVVLSAISDKSKVYQAEYQKKTELQGRLHEARSNLSNLVAHHKEQIFEAYRKTVSENHRLKSEIEYARKDVVQLETRTAEMASAMKANEQFRLALRKNWHKVMAEEFSADQLVCPACKRPFDNPDQVLSERREAFNRDKSFRLEKISEEGRLLKIKYEQLAEESSKLTEGKEKLLLKIQALEARFIPAEEPRFDENEVPGYQQARSMMDQLEKEYDLPIAQPDVEDLKMKAEDLQNSVQEIKEKLSTREQISAGNQRIEQLKLEQKNLAQELANLERQEFQIQKFERAKAEAIEGKINGMFELVRWKLFDRQINGQEIPACIATFKEVPYSDLNSAAKANVGLDIINTLSRHYKVVAPVFFDNREGVNRLINTPSQLINLSVSKDPELVIEI